MTELLKTKIGRFRLLALGEGVSFLLILFITMPLKYWLYIGWPNKIVGMAHGVLFVIYVLAVIEMKMAYKWNLNKTVAALIASIIPFGTFYFVKKYNLQKV